MWTRIGGGQRMYMWTQIGGGQADVYGSGKEYVGGGFIWLER